MKKIDWMLIVRHLEEWLEKLKRKNLTFFGKLLTAGLVLFFLSDLSALLIEHYLPATPSSGFRGSAPGMQTGQKVRIQPEAYDVILSRNLFDSKQVEDDSRSDVPSQVNPVRTQLPLSLIGTAILTNPKRSIGTIEDKSAQLIYPLRADDEVPGKLRVTRVEPRRMVFVNLASNRLEFVDLPEEQILSNPIITTSNLKKPFPAAGGGIKKVSETQFNVSRAEIDKSMQNLGVVLTQARALPNFENGVQNGYRLTQIVPGSIYEKIGMKDGEVIMGINNDSVNDPAKAFQLLNELKTSNHLEIKVKTTDGKEVTRVYDIN